MKFFFWANQGSFICKLSENRDPCFRQVYKHKTEKRALPLKDVTLCNPAWVNVSLTEVKAIKLRLLLQRATETIPEEFRDLESSLLWYRGVKWVHATGCNSRCWIKSLSQKFLGCLCEKNHLIGVLFFQSSFVNLPDKGYLSSES